MPLLPMLALLAPPLTPPREFEDRLAFVDAKVEVGDGTTLPRATVLVADGRIERVATDATVPDWYRRIDAKGLTLTPAFIDAYYPLTNLPATPDSVGADTNTSVDPPVGMALSNRRGIRAQLDAATLPPPPDEALDAERKAGFGLLNLVPASSYIGGTAALVESSAENRRSAVVARGLGRAVGFFYAAPTGAPRGYPSSLMGAIAQMRQFFLDAQNPALPGDDVALLAVRDDRPRRAFWQADTENELRRAVKLGNEFGYEVVPVGAALLSDATDAVSGPVIYSPRPSRLLRPPIGTRAIKERDGRLAAIREGNAKALANRPFALTRAGYPDRADFFKDLRDLVKAGLPEPKVMRGLTLGAAEVLGVADRVGSVTEGKRAYLAVFTKSPLDGRARYLVLDGRLVELTEDRLAPGGRPRVPSTEDLCGCGGNPEHDHPTSPPATEPARNGGHAK